MATFDDWYDWAVGEGSDWNRVAANAKRGGRYEKADASDVFMASVGNEDPRTIAPMTRRVSPIISVGKW